MNARIAVVTGAGSGIGAASARALAADGFEVVCAARRADRIAAVAAEIGGRAMVCDVTDPEAVAALADDVGDRVDVLVNNAGGALDLATVAQADPEVWRDTFEVNVLGLVRVTQVLLPALRASGNGLVINIGSTAGRSTYEGGGGYVAAKQAVRALSETMRLELLDEPVRICEIAPGMVATEEFSLVRFGGDQRARDAVYAGVPNPLVAEDVAEAVRWVASLPAHVSVDELVLRPKAQAANHKVKRV